MQTAVKYLADLKEYLNGLVIFFREVHILVTVTLRQETKSFINIATTAAVGCVNSTDPQAYARAGCMGKRGEDRIRSEPTCSQLL